MISFESPPVTASKALLSDVINKDALLMVILGDLS